MTYDEVNKVYLKGTIVTSPTLKFNTRANEYLLFFTLAVPRTKPLYLKGQNFDEYNYFYCVLSESNHIMSNLKLYERTYMRMDYIEIKGCLDNRLNKKTQIDVKDVNYRTLNCFVSVIDVLAMKHAEEDRETEEVELNKKLLGKLQSNFGSDVSVKVAQDAFDKDYYGFNNEDNLPDY